MIFIDMDGTIAKFYEKPNYLERMYEKGFFRNLKPYSTAEYFNNLIKQGAEICILSACVDTPFCKQEKSEWLKQYLPNLEFNRCIFTNIGESKVEACRKFLVENKISCKQAILLDDYSVNLYDWTCSYADCRFIPIKYCNGVNNTSGKQYCYKVKNTRELDKILKSIGEIK